MASYDNSEKINYQGVFGQIEYATDRFTIFAQGAFSNQSYEREDRFDDGVKSDKISKTGYNIKGGLSYNITPDNTIFLNAGQYSRQPYLDNVFNRNRGQITEPISPAVENEKITNPAVENEKITNSGANQPANYVVTETYDANPWSTLFDYAPEEDRIAYDNSEKINYQGVFGHLRSSLR